MATIRTVMLLTVVWILGCAPEVNTEWANPADRDGVVKILRHLKDEPEMNRELWQDPDAETLSSSRYQSSLWDIVTSVPDADTILSNLNADQIGEAVAWVTSLVIDDYEPSSCKNLISLQLYLGSFEYMLELEFSAASRSVYATVKRWAETASESLGEREVKAVVDVLLKPPISWISEFCTSLGVNRTERAFFNALAGAVKSARGSYFQLNTVTLKTTLLKLLKQSEPLFVLDTDVCTRVDQANEVADLMELIVWHLMQGAKDDLIMFGILNEASAEDMFEFLFEEHRFSKQFQIAAELPQMQGKDLLTSLRYRFSGKFFSPIIAYITEEVELDESALDAVAKQFPDLNFSEPIDYSNLNDLNQVLNYYLEHHFQRFNRECPDVFLTEIFLGFLRYSAYSLMEEVKYIVDELRQLSMADDLNIYSYNYKYVRKVKEWLESDRNGGRSRHKRSHLQRADVYDQIACIQDLVLARLEVGLEPIQSQLSADAASDVMLSFENYILDAISNRQSMYELLEVMESKMLNYTADSRSRLCNGNEDLFSNMTTLLLNEAPRLMVPVSDVEVYRACSMDIFDFTLNDQKQLMDVFASYFLVEKLRLRLTRVVELVNHDCRLDIEHKLAGQITSTIADNIRLANDLSWYYWLDDNDYSYVNADYHVSEMTAEELFKEHDQELLSSWLSGFDFLQVLEIFFTRFMAEAEVQGFDSGVLTSILDTVIHEVLSAK